MKKLILGALVGTALVIAVKVLKDNGQLDSVRDDLNKYSLKTKKKLNDALASGKNQIDYVKNRIDYKIQKEKREMKNMQNHQA